MNKLEEKIRDLLPELKELKKGFQFKLIDNFSCGHSGTDRSGDPVCNDTSCYNYSGDYTYRERIVEVLCKTDDEIYVFDKEDLEWEPFFDIIGFGTESESFNESERYPEGCQFVEEIGHPITLFDIVCALNKKKPIVSDKMRGFMSCGSNIWSFNLSENPTDLKIECEYNHKKPLSEQKPEVLDFLSEIIL